MKCSWIVLIFLCLNPFFLFSQVEQHFVRLSLQDVIDLAAEQSPSSHRAQTLKENRYWQYNTYLSNYRPQLVLSGGNEFSREVVPVRQNDGTVAFPQVNQNYTSLDLSLEQRIGFSGSRIFLSSSLQRFDNFFTGNLLYSGQPAFIGITQPLFFFNGLKWDRKIEPLRYEESKRRFGEDMEAISVKATDLFFSLLLAQAGLNIAQTNLENNQKLFEEAKEQFESGKSTENELLQLELSVMQANQQLAKAELDLETSSLSLKSYIGGGSTSGNSLILIAPLAIPDFTVDTETALLEASKNRRATVAFKRRQLEAERNVARAKGNSGINANIRATFGFTNRGDALSQVYERPDDQQAVLLNFSLPVMDWGRQKSRVKTAEANQELIAYTVAQDQINFEQEVITQVRLFEMLRKQVVIAQKSDKLAQRRHELAQLSYSGKEISITTLNIATQEKDEAKRSFVAALRDFWIAYYKLRQLTLYDFENNRPLKF